ncbi:sub C member 14 [Branchiostoma belcheri]|nr:sub C member 14 [Branchiostoma belcheri]
MENVPIRDRVTAEERFESAQVCLSQGEVEEAHRLLQEAVRLDPSNIVYKDSLQEVVRLRDQQHSVYNDPATTTFSFFHHGGPGDASGCQGAGSDEDGPLKLFNIWSSWSGFGSPFGFNLPCQSPPPDASPHLPSQPAPGTPQQPSHDAPQAAAQDQKSQGRKSEDFDFDIQYRPKTKKGEKDTTSGYATDAKAFNLQDAAREGEKMYKDAFTSWKAKPHTPEPADKKANAAKPKVAADHLESLGASRVVPNVRYSDIASKPPKPAAPEPKHSQPRTANTTSTKPTGKKAQKKQRVYNVDLNKQEVKPDSKYGLDSFDPSSESTMHRAESMQSVASTSSNSSDRVASAADRSHVSNGRVQTRTFSMDSDDHTEDADPVRKADHSPARPAKTTTAGGKSGSEGDRPSQRGGHSSRTRHAVDELYCSGDLGTGRQDTELQNGFARLYQEEEEEGEEEEHRTRGRHRGSARHTDGGPPKRRSKKQRKGASKKGGLWHSNNKAVMMAREVMLGFWFLLLDFSTWTYQSVAMAAERSTPFLYQGITALGMLLMVFSDWLREIASKAWDWFLERLFRGVEWTNQRSARLWEWLKTRAPVSRVEAGNLANKAVSLAKQVLYGAVSLVVFLLVLTYLLVKQILLWAYRGVCYVINAVMRRDRKGRSQLETEGLEENIELPATGEEAVRRLLSMKDRDPWSILGVRRDACADDVKKYYRRQAVLVHPDKNQLPGAEEAFKILGHAFEVLADPMKRREYIQQKSNKTKVDEAMEEFFGQLEELRQRLQEAIYTMRCDRCGEKHRRVPMDRPWYAARFCTRCNTHHCANEGDIWVETTMMGFKWHYFAVMDSEVCDITEWARCQTELHNLQPNSHFVQCRIDTKGARSAKNFFNPNRPREDELDEFLANLFYEAMKEESRREGGAAAPGHAPGHAPPQSQDFTGAQPKKGGKRRKKRR